MWNIHDYDVRNGETKRVNCPVCRGHKTFTITNQMGSLVWNCYKASCDVSGGKRVSLSVTDIKNSFKEQERKEEDWQMPDNLVYHPPYTQAFTDKWSIPHDVELMYDVKEDRVVFTLWNNYRCVDAIGRATDNRLPKWRRYGNSDLPFTYGRGNVAVVVEDCVSAVVVGEIDVYVGVAVLGTSLSEAHKKYLSQFSMAIVALDPDALPKTMQFAKELRQHVSTVKVLKLTDDLKYRREVDLYSLTNLPPF
tara:strand:+ start:853 stop:1602 length:750 start_codon:yes stop_codon:yes gene_type:complete